MIIDRGKEYVPVYTNDVTPLKYRTALLGFEDRMLVDESGRETQRSVTQLSTVYSCIRWRIDKCGQVVRKGPMFREDVRENGLGWDVHIWVDRFVDPHLGEYNLR